MATYYTSTSTSTGFSTTVGTGSTSTTYYTAGYDPYKKEAMRDKQGRRLDKRKKLIEVGQLIISTYLVCGLVVGFSRSGNPRVVEYDLQTELPHRTPGYAGHRLFKSVWRERRLLIYREAFDPRTNIDKEVQQLIEG